MQKNTILSILISIVLSIISSPFIGSFISNFYIPYAKSDDEISVVFEISTLVSFFILSGALYILFSKYVFQKNKIANK